MQLQLEKASRKSSAANGEEKVHFFVAYGIMNWNNWINTLAAVAMSVTVITNDRLHFASFPSNSYHLNSFVASQTVMVCAETFSARVAMRSIDGCRLQQQLGLMNRCGFFSVQFDHFYHKSQTDLSKRNHCTSNEIHTKNQSASSPKCNLDDVFAVLNK